MEVSAAGAGSANPQDAEVRPAAAAGAKIAGPSQGEGNSDDRIATSLLGLANSQIGELLGRVEHVRQAQDPAALHGLLQSATAAVAAHNLPGALTAITELVTRHPEHGAQLVREATSLAPIRVEVNDLMQRLALDAKSQAEHVLAAASLAIEGRMHAHGPGFNPQGVLALGQRFLESGQHINFVRAAELGQAVLAYYPEGRIDDAAPDGSRELRRAESGAELLRLAERLRTLWRRAPVLVLLLVWLTLGVAALAILGQQADPSVTGIWALGFLVLVVFQFFATIRNARF